MKRLVSLVFLACSGCGLCSPCNSVGWRYEIGRPSILAVPAAMQQTSGPIEMLPAATAQGGAIMGVRQAPLCPCIDQAAYRFRGPALDPCDVIDGREQLRQMEQHLKALQRHLDEADRLRGAQKMPPAP